MGPNGSGRTTLVQLMLGLYEPTEGRILLDGVDVREFDAASCRRLFGALFQDFVRYDFTAAENVGVGRLEASTIDGASRRRPRSVPPTR